MDDSQKIMTFTALNNFMPAPKRFFISKKKQNLFLTDEKKMPYSLFPRQVKKTDECEFIQIGRKNCDSWRQYDFALSPGKNLLNRVRR